MLLPALQHAKTAALSVKCMSNKKQLQIAWSMYAGDNHDTLADNHDYVDYGEYSPPKPPGTPCWCEGNVKFESPPAVPSDETNIQYLIGSGFSLLGPYVGLSSGASAGGGVQVFTCPADHYVPAGSGWGQRCRSIAMDGNIGPGARWDFGWTLTNPIVRMGNFTTPGASMSWVFLDEHPDWLDDAQFYINPGDTNQGGTGAFTELPGSYHNNACGISFADGHAEIHTWLDSRTKPPIELQYHWDTVTITTPSRDLLWMAQRTPYQ